MLVDFSNGDRIGIIPNEATNPSHAVGIRLFVKALTLYANVSVLKSGIGAEEIISLFDRGVFDLDVVLSVIGSQYRKWLNLTSKDTLPIVVIFDEFQRTLELVTNSKELAKVLGDVMCVTTGPNLRLSKYNILFVPVIAGTVSAELSFELTDYENLIVELPLFPLKVVTKLVLEAGLPMHVLLGREKARFWMLMGLVPRSLAYAVQVTQELLKFPQFKSKQLVGNDDKLFTENLFTMVEDFLRRKYKMGLSQSYTGSKNQDTSLLSMAAIGVSIEDGMEWIAKLERQGQIYLDEHRRVFLPYIVFSTLRNRHASYLPKALLPELSSSFTWQMFESLNASILALRINYHVNLKKSSVLLLDLWPGAYYGGKMKDLELCVQHARVAYETVPYITKLNDVITVHKDRDVYIDVKPNMPISKDNLPHYILQAVENHARTDFRWFTTTTDDEDVLIVVQCKYVAEPNEPNTYEECISESPKFWYESILPHLSNAYPTYMVIGVFITNANIPKKAQEAVETCSNLLIIDASVSNAYFAPNILPYVRTMEPKIQNQKW